MINSDKNEKYDVQKNERGRELDQNGLPNVYLPFRLDPATSVVNLVRNLLAYGYAKESSTERTSRKLKKDVDYCSNRTTESAKCHGHCDHRIDVSARRRSRGGDDERYEDRVTDEYPRGYGLEWPRCKRCDE